MTLFGVDVAVYQSRPDWKRVYAAGIRFGFSKVTEGRTYTNATWAHNRAAMAALGPGFLPGAYLFLDPVDGAAQADRFAAVAGKLDGFAIAVDLERAPGGNPTAAQARACVARLRHHYPGRPIGGYAPRWYTGPANLEFFDYLWASHYVTGTGSPTGLYSKVPASWWGAYGGMPPVILQFTSSATVPGISGRCDANAYRGTLDQLKELTLGEDDMALSADDKKWLTEMLYKGVWTPDRAPTPAGAPDAGTNKAYQPINIGRETYTLAAKILPLVTQIASQTADIDEDALAAALLTKLAPERIAQLVAEGLPADLAKQVADDLVSRLEA